MKSIAVIIVAAGRGHRAGEGLPKQYRKIAGKTVLRTTLEALRKHLPSAVLQVVIHPDDMALYQKSVINLDLTEPVFGGDTRQASVLNGLLALKASTPDYILVHDAARPFLNAALVDRLLTALDNGANAVIPALAVTDTLKSVEQGMIKSTVNRDGLYSVQTPQAFVYKELISAHEISQGQEFTDDGAVMEAHGATVTICDGQDGNFKITNAADLNKAEAHIMMQTGDVRIGSGYDVHRFTTGDHVWLGGIKIPFSNSLKGHSDADVALHAITDALLAAATEGDIGSHFPPDEEKWRGVRSQVFLEHAAKIITEKDGIIAHVCVVIICEAPKIGPHSQNMRNTIADILGISADRVSVQATTTEQLGFTGRKEGIAAQATATIRLPLGEQ